MADNLKGIPFSSDDEGIDFPQRAKHCVLYAYNEVYGFSVGALRLDEIYVVWFAFVRGNWKAILSTSRPDGRIYEVSSKRLEDGSESLIVDSYLKTHNIEMP